MFTGKKCFKYRPILHSSCSSFYGMLCTHGTRLWRTYTLIYVTSYVFSFPGNFDRLFNRPHRRSGQETRVIETNEMRMTNELHVIRAHQLHYHELLEHFRKSVEFVMKYPNPTYDNASEQERKLTKDLLERECNQLLAGINRLEMSRKLQDKRLKNVMNLVRHLHLSLHQVS